VTHFFKQIKHLEMTSLVDQLRGNEHPAKARQRIPGILHLKKNGGCGQNATASCAQKGPMPLKKISGKH
jgi:hypothetical protein